MNSNPSFGAHRPAQGGGDPNQRDQGASTPEEQVQIALRDDAAQRQPQWFEAYRRQHHQRHHSSLHAGVGAPLQPADQLSTLVAGYLLVFRQAPLAESDALLLARKRFELDLLSLPRAEYPNVVASARDLADAQFSNPQQQMKGIADFIVGGVAAMLEKRTGSEPGRRPRRASNSASD